MSTIRGLFKREIYGIVNRYIGVHGGYLGDLSYRTHHDFYLEYCDLEINPSDYEGTTRDKFIQILSESDARTQARILEGVLHKYPIGSDPLRTEEQFGKIEAMVTRLRASSPVETPDVGATSEVVQRAISDAKTLIESSGATSGVDRVHTALHGYLKAACDEASLSSGDSPSITNLFRLIREEHPAFKSLGYHQTQVVQVLRALSSIVDTLNPARNRGSLAHPNQHLLEHDEAMLFINSSYTILHYLDSKLSKTI